jgi:hypothetical protein
MPSTQWEYFVQGLVRDHSSQSGAASGLTIIFESPPSIIRT